MLDLEIIQDFRLTYDRYADDAQIRLSVHLLFVSVEFYNQQQLMEF